MSLANLDAKSQQEMQEFVLAEQNKARNLGLVRVVTDSCFEKCITNASKSDLSEVEKSCLKSCFQIFAKVNTAAVEQIQKNLS